MLKRNEGFLLFFPLKMKYSVGGQVGTGRGWDQRAQRLVVNTWGLKTSKGKPQIPRLNTTNSWGQKTKHGNPALLLFYWPQYDEQVSKTMAYHYQLSTTLQSTWKTCFREEMTKQWKANTKKCLTACSCKIYIHGVLMQSVVHA